MGSHYRGFLVATLLSVAKRALDKVSEPVHDDIAFCLVKRVIQAATDLVLQKDSAIPDLLACQRTLDRSRRDMCTGKSAADGLKQWRADRIEGMQNAMACETDPDEREEIRKAIADFKIQIANEDKDQLAKEAMARSHKKHSEKNLRKLRRRMAGAEGKAHEKVFEWMVGIASENRANAIYLAQNPDVEAVRSAYYMLSAVLRPLTRALMDDEEQAALEFLTVPVPPRGRRYPMRSYWTILDPPEKEKTIQEMKEERTKAIEMRARRREGEAMLDTIRERQRGLSKPPPAPKRPLPAPQKLPPLKGPSWDQMDAMVERGIASLDRPVAAPAKKVVVVTDPAKKVAAPAKKVVVVAAPAKKVVVVAAPAKKGVVVTAPAKKVVVVAKKGVVVTAPAKKGVVVTDPAKKGATTKPRL